MTNLMSCESCESFIPGGARACPHCTRLPSRSAIRRWASALTSVAGGSALAMTLMACYGSPPCDEINDDDNDGFVSCVDNGNFELFDCDDNDPDVNPDAEDPEGDGIDQNCDGVDGVFSLEEDAGPPGEDAGPEEDAGT